MHSDLNFPETRRNRLGILHEVGKFYQKLFKARGVNQTLFIDSLFNSKSVTKPSENQLNKKEILKNRRVSDFLKINEK